MGLLIALFGTTIYSAGVILQKKGSGWMGWKGKVDLRCISMFSLWLAGMLLSYVVSALTMGVASKSLPPYIVSAVSGWGMVVIVFLSNLYLKERIHKSDIVYSLVIITCVLLISRFQSPETEPAISRLYLYILLLAPFILLAPVFFPKTPLKHKVVLLSVFSGFMGGMVIVLMNILVRESGDSFLGIAGSFNLYAYFAAGLCSVAAKQAAYRLGDVVLVTPLQTSFSMIYPLICTYFIYHSAVNTVQILLVLVIVLACWQIQSKR